jgi:hypothetical protein
MSTLTDSATNFGLKRKYSEFTDVNSIKKTKTNPAFETGVNSEVVNEKYKEILLEIEKLKTQNFQLQKEVISLKNKVLPKQPEFISYIN